MPSPTRERRNFWILALHQIVIRVGWIFKTETVIMPGFLDALDVSGAVRGCLPTLNRIGQSKGYIRVQRKKNRAVKAISWKIKRIRGDVCIAGVMMALPGRARDTAQKSQKLFGSRAVPEKLAV